MPWANAEVPVHNQRNERHQRRRTTKTSRLDWLPWNIDHLRRQSTRRSTISSSISDSQTF